MSACAIVVSYRTGAVLADCLDALAQNAALSEIVLVDNGNAPTEVATLDVFAGAHTHARLLRGQGNVGFAAACNRGAALAVSDVLIFVNPDAVLAPDAVARLCTALAVAPPPAIVGGDLRDAGGRPERGSRRDRLTLWRAFTSFTGLWRLEHLVPAFRDFNRHRDPMPAGPTRVGAISGALLGIRRADFAALGGFDEGYFLHVEDIDLCRRAEEAGWPVLFVPGPHGVHARSSSHAEGAVVARHKARGMARYFKKFARGPIEGALASLAGGVLLLLAPGKP